MVENLSRKELGEILKSAKRIAVVGLSDNPMKTSYTVIEAMKDAGYEIIPVNPNIDSVFGIKAVASLKEVKGPIDIVNVFRRPGELMPIAKEFLELECPTFWVQSGIINEEVYKFLKVNKRTVVMDRCIKIEHSLTK